MDDLLQALADRLGLERRLGVHAAQQRLAEVGQRRAGEAADESLRADDAELEPGDRARPPRAVEHVHARLLENRAQLVDATGVEVVVAEHGEDRDREPRGTRPRARCACSGSPVVVRSPASRIDVRLALDLRERRAARARASPPTRGRRPLLRCGSHERCCTTGRTGNGAAHARVVVRRAGRGDEGRGRRSCSRARSRSCSAAASRRGRAAGRRASTTSTSC